ncbi:hypothetical protein RB195_022182 [Necator americanus]|uniref:Uncharacterized protein n=1 Tax=Necator americanus TaxID=51031 RepID=A0ABR1EE87_NECAM
MYFISDILFSREGDVKRQDAVNKMLENPTYKVLGCAPFARRIVMHGSCVCLRCITERWKNCSIEQETRIRDHSIIHPSTPADEKKEGDCAIAVGND